MVKEPPITSPGERLFVIIWRPGPNWKKAPPVTDQDLTRHRAYFADLSTAGLVATAGPFLDESGGGLAILKVANIADAIHIMRADPAIEGAVFEGDVRPYYVVFPK